MDSMSNLALLGADIRSNTGAGKSAKAPEGLLLGLAGGNAAEGGVVELTLGDPDGGQTFVVSFQEVVDALVTGNGLPAGGNALPAPLQEGLMAGDEAGSGELSRDELLGQLVQQLQRQLATEGALPGDGGSVMAANAPAVLQELLAFAGLELDVSLSVQHAGQGSGESLAVRLMQPGAQGRLLPRETALEMAAPVATLAASASLRLESPVSSTPGDDGLLADSTRPPAPLPLLSSSVRQLLIEGGNLDVEAGDLEAAFPRLSTAMPSVLQQALAAAGVRVPEPVDGQPVGASFAGSPFGSVTALSASPSAVTAMRPEFVVAEPFGGERWAQAVGERVMMLLGRDQQMAELKLTPPNLGQLEVRVSVQQDQASVAFVSQHAAVRDALEQAIPRLREMLAQQDLQLVNVDVSQRETGQQAGSADAGRGRSGSGGGDMAGDGAALSESGLPSGRVLQGMVDLFA